MGNVSGIKSCYGCGACAIACGKHLISIKENKDGFYTPFIENTEACTDCGLCESVCSYTHDELATKNVPIISFGAWSKDENVRRRSSSGGVCFEFEKYLLDNGYKICVVRYNIQLRRAEHYIADNLNDLDQGLGSKYIQSYTLDAFSSMKRDEKYLVVGSPCQMDSFRRYVKKFRLEDNFILIDFFCHGVPSSILWKKYLNSVSNSIEELSGVAWRNKQFGWHDSYAISLSQESIKERQKENISRFSTGNAFYEMFFCDSCFNKACYSKCKFKYDQSSADVRVGDFWGNTYKDDDKGVSAVVAFTEKGKSLIMNSDIERTEHPFEVVAEGQMKSSLILTLKDKIIFNILKTDIPLKMVVACKRVLNKIEKYMKK